MATPTHYLDPNDVMYCPTAGEWDTLLLYREENLEICTGCNEVNPPVLKVAEADAEALNETPC